MSLKRLDMDPKVLEGMSDDEIYCHIRERGYPSILCEAFRKGTLPTVNRLRTLLGLGHANSSIVTINYNLTLREMILACHFDKVDGRGISATNFPLTGTGIVKCEVKAFRFGPGTYVPLAASDKIISLDKKKPWSPGKIEHLLAFAQEFPEIQRISPILPPGHTKTKDHYGRRIMPYLAGNTAERRLMMMDGMECDSPRPTPTCLFLGYRVVETITENVANAA